MREFIEGDLVAIRDWEDMLAEYGTTRYDDINCTLTFAKGMRPLCGEVATVTDILSNGRVILDFKDKKINKMSWKYSTDMIRCYDDYVDDFEPDDESLISFLNFK